MFSVVVVVVVVVGSYNSLLSILLLMLQQKATLEAPDAVSDTKPKEFQFHSIVKILVFVWWFWCLAFYLQWFDSGKRELDDYVIVEGGWGTELVGFLSP